MHAIWSLTMLADWSLGGEGMSVEGTRGSTRHETYLRVPRRATLVAVLGLGAVSISTACGGNPPPAPTEAPVIASAYATPAESRPLPRPSYPYPAAMLLFNRWNGRLDLISQDGIGLGDLGTIAWAEPDRRRGAPVGTLEGDPGGVRFAYLSASADGMDLYLRSATGTSKLGEFAAEALLAGSTPAGLLAVSAPHPDKSSGETEASIFMIDPLRRTGLENPAVDGLDPRVVPLRLQLDDGQPVGIVYCLSRSGHRIAEDDLCHGLYRVDLSSGEVDEIAPANLAIVALSPDMRITALASDDRIPPDVRLRNLETGAEIVFKSEAGVREVGGGAIAPAGTRLAWVSLTDGDGGERLATVSLASIAGGPVTLLANTSLSEAVEATVTEVALVGWLDEARLLLELRTSRGWALYVLLMPEGRIDHVAAGRLAGFVYR